MMSVRGAGGRPGVTLSFPDHCAQRRRNWGGTGGTCPPLLRPKMCKVPLIYPEFPVQKLPQAPVPPPTFRSVPPSLVGSGPTPSPAVLKIPNLLDIIYTDFDANFGIKVWFQYFPNRYISLHNIGAHRDIWTKLTK